MDKSLLLSCLLGLVVIGGTYAQVCIHVYHIENDIHEVMSHINPQHCKTSLNNVSKQQVWFKVNQNQICKFVITLFFIAVIAVQMFCLLLVVPR